MDKQIELNAEIDEEHARQRLDKTLAIMFPDFSRSQLQAWIEDGSITVNGNIWRPREKVKGGEIVLLRTADSK